ncbi:MAG: type II toxin-antitoxin system VapC family toxin [Gemmatimonadales bacterium]
MNGVFLDTSAWFAALNEHESTHAVARDCYESLVDEGQRLLTSNLVVAELQALVTGRIGPHAGLTFLESVRRDPTHQIIFVTQELETVAIDRWLRPFGDHPLSLADAVSFELMRSERIKTAFALDTHFRVAGFETLPKLGRTKSSKKRKRR